MFRLSRGNAMARFFPIVEPVKDPTSAVRVHKSVFYIVVLGQQLLTKVTRVCDAHQATIYSVPPTTMDCFNVMAAIQREIADTHAVHKATEKSIRRQLQRLVLMESGNGVKRCPLKDWLAALHHERAIQGVLLKAHYYLTMIAIEGWIPSEEVGALKQCVKLAVAGTGLVPAAVETSPANPIRRPGAPPTYFKTNTFTATFQAIVDTYGVPRYKEINPGLFTIISFPFLFGVMYGDIGHGTLLTMFGLFLVLNEKRFLQQQKRGELGEIGGMAFGGRYALLLMGMFAVYCGMIYNDCFSISLNVYGSTFYTSSDSSDSYMKSDGTTYPLGLDPEWSHKPNQLAFYNSFKMKMSVIFGVVQMLFGIVLSLFNHLYFGDRLSIWFEFVPRMVFMLSTFGYMCWMILYKWTVDWNNSSVSPPNLIQTMISMFLNVGTVDSAKQLYQGQAGFQTFLVLAALFSVPVMLFAKPCLKHRALQRDALLRRQNDDDHSSSHANLLSIGTGSTSPSPSTSTTASSLIDDDDSALSATLQRASSAVNVEVSEHEEHSLSDDMIHNAIHTIEFVLGAVSNTASYLRLWALSLAHAELSGVFWDKMIIQYGLQTGSSVSALVGFSAWAGATFGVLLCMDVLECFLHALRLHWVEFQGKFYNADGIAFEPYELDSFSAQ